MDHDGWFGPLGPPPRPGGRPGFSVIRPDLLVGEYPTAGDVAWLRDTHGVTAVVCLQDDGDLASKGIVLRQLEAAYATHAVAFHRIPIPDGDDRHLVARIPDIVAVLGRLRDEGARTYLHCNAGFNRAPSAAIAFLHVRDGLSLLAARDFVKQCRPCVPYMRALEAHFRTPAP
jgi:hypothetical protein